MAQALIVLATFLAAFTQSLSGFGDALIPMAILPGLLGSQVATPLVAVVAPTIELVLLVYYRSAINLKSVFPLILASFFGIPLGIYALRRLDQEIFLTVLGFVLAAYSLYALLDFRLPELKHPAWAYGTGFLAGLLGGAYNTSGPPVVVYGNCRRWVPAEFKGNLQGFFVVSSLSILIGHAWSHNLTPLIWGYYAWALPGIAAGILAGLSLNRILNPAVFRKIVLWLLVVIGIRLILTPLIG